MSQMTGAELMVRALAAAGVRHVFGIVGAHAQPVWDLFNDETVLTPVFVRHENAASYAACGYARVSGEMAAFLVEPGVAALHTLPGVLDAFTDSLPLLAITTQIPLHLLGRASIHDCDLEAPFKGMVKAQFVVRTAAEIPGVVAQATRIAREGRPGPVHLVIPRTVWREKATSEVPRIKAAERPPLSPQVMAQLKEATARLNSAKNPLIYAGFGVVKSGAVPALRALSQRLSAPVMTSWNGRGIVPEDSPLAAGVLTFDGSEDILRAADVCLAIGTHFSEVSTLGWSYKLPAELIQIDIDPTILGKNYPLALGITGDARQVLEALVGLVEQRRPSDLHQVLHEVRQRRQDSLRSLLSQKPALPIHPQRLLNTLRGVLPRDAVLVCDLSGPQLWMMSAPAYTVYGPATLIGNDVALGIGLSLGTSIGARLASQGRPVACIVGDGSLMYQIGEIATALAHRVPFLTIVFNDGAYNIPRLYEKRMFGRLTGVELNNPDFVQLARAFGAAAYRLERPEDLPDLLRKGLAEDRFTLIDVPVYRDELPPFLERRLQALSKPS